MSRALVLASCATSVMIFANLAFAGTLALPLIARDRPVLVVAQRVIDREWGPSDDSVYVELDIPQWRSEGGAGALSAAIPGAGQIYAGEKTRGLLFMLAEITGWTTRLIYRHRGNEIRDISKRYAGSPLDSTSAWSFDRWAEATHQDPAQLEALYRADPEAFYQLIAGDSRYLDGWKGEDPLAARQVFSDIRSTSDVRFRFARFTTEALWINHLIAAVDALRAARLHNLPLRQNLDLRLKSGWRHGGPTWSAALQARF